MQEINNWYYDQHPQQLLSQLQHSQYFVHDLMLPK